LFFELRRALFEELQHSQIASFAVRLERHLLLGDVILELFDLLHSRVFGFLGGGVEYLKSGLFLGDLCSDLQQLLADLVEGLLVAEQTPVRKLLELLKPLLVAAGGLFQQ